MGSLQDKVALVTGGKSGIGLASAKAFAAAGAQVVIVARRHDAVARAVSEIGANALGIPGDIADIATHERVAAEIWDRFGGLDVYMANAGVNTIAPTAEVTSESYDTQFAINTRGVFFGVQAMIPLLRNGGSIVLTGSMASEKVLDGHAVYAGSKAAINAFARSWAIELKSRRIRVNVLSPGPTGTEILTKLGIHPDHHATFEQATAEKIPLGRLGRPDELARAALFLASDDSSFITGVNLVVDGGMTLL